jgi:MoxR-like ATPase
VEIADRTTAPFDQQVEPAADAAMIHAMQKLARAVPIAPHVTAFSARLLKASHPGDPNAPVRVRDFVRYGASPRGMQAMILAGKIIALMDGRYNVAYDDIRQVAIPALRHRLILNFEAHAEFFSSDTIIQDLIEITPTEE